MLQQASSPSSSFSTTSRARSSGSPRLEAPAPGLTGRRFGHVRLDALLDRGGMGEVYRGFDEALERPVAVKVVRAEDRPTAKARDRFWREARLLSKLDHPNICRVHDLLTDETVGDVPLDLLVLEFVEGEKLGDRLRRGLRPAEKLRIAREIAAALDAAHRLRIVHRDLKPSNVMIRPGGQVKVLDFGLARSLDTPAPLTPPPIPPSTDSQKIILDDDGNPVDMVPVATDHSSHGLLVGTLEYMSPEQALGETVTEASDLYAFGLLLQWLFTERAPYGEDRNRYDLMRRVLAGDTEPIQAERRRGRAGFDPELLLLIEALKRPNPTHRPTAAQCVEHLARLAAKPARRRTRRTLWSVSLVALGLILATVLWNRQQALQRTELAMGFAQEAKDMEWAMRLGRSLPLHALTPHEREVQRRMNTVAGRLQISAGFARGPAEYALGRGHLELGDWSAARRRLERAWALGHRRPEVALALGDVLGRLARDASDEALLDPSPAWAEDRRRWADTTLRASALDHLRAARGPGLGTGALADAMVAFHERRPDEARELARRVILAVPWLYEARLVEGDAAAATGAFDDALAAYAAAAEVAPSDPRIHTAECRAGSLRAATDQLSERDREAAESACDRILVADPDQRRGQLLRARLQALAGDLDAAIAIAERTRPGRGSSAAISAAGHRLLAMLYRRRAADTDDPRDALSRAVEHGQRAIALDGSDPGGHAAAGRAALALAQTLVARGDANAETVETTLDPLLADAILALQGYRRLRPEFVPVYAELARAYLLRAEWLVVAGESPDDALTAARRAVARGRRLAPEDAEILDLLDQLTAAEATAAAS